MEKKAWGEPTYEHLVEKVLNELVVQRPRSEQSVEICSKQLSHEVAAEQKRSKISFGPSRLL
jgi:hypothetical protein